MLTDFLHSTGPFGLVALLILGWGGVFLWSWLTPTGHHKMMDLPPNSYQDSSED